MVRRRRGRRQTVRRRSLRLYRRDARSILSSILISMRIKSYSCNHQAHDIGQVVTIIISVPNEQRPRSNLSDIASLHPLMTTDCKMCKLCMKLWS